MNNTSIFTPSKPRGYLVLAIWLGLLGNSTFITEMVLQWNKKKN